MRLKRVIVIYEEESHRYSIYSSPSKSVSLFNFKAGVRLDIKQYVSKITVINGDKKHFEERFMYTLLQKPLVFVQKSQTMRIYYLIADLG